MHPSVFPLPRILIVCSKIFVPFAEEELCDSLPCINLLHYYRYDLSAVFSPRKEKNDSFKTMCKYFKLFQNKICFVLFFFKAEYSLGWEDAICLHRFHSAHLCFSLSPLTIIMCFFTSKLRVLCFIGFSVSRSPLCI